MLNGADYDAVTYLQCHNYRYVKNFVELIVAKGKKKSTFVSVYYENIDVLFQKYSHLLKLQTTKQIKLQNYMVLDLVPVPVLVAPVTSFSH